MLAAAAAAAELLLVVSSKLTDVRLTALGVTCEPSSVRTPRLRTPLHVLQKNWEDFSQPVLPVDLPVVP